MAKIEDKINKEVEKARKRFGETFDEQQFVTTNARVLELKAQHADTGKNSTASWKPMIWWLLSS